MAQDDERYEQARKRVTELKSLYMHIALYILINLLLFLLNYLSSPGVWWFYWVTIFWGIGLAWHIIGFIGGPKVFTPEWEEQKIQEFMKQEGKR